MLKLIHYITILCCVAALWSCTGSTSNETANDKSEKKIFRYNQPNAVTSLDPAFARNLTNMWAVSHLYNGLVQLDEALNIQPAIARRWRIADEGLTYVFELRDDVYFQDSEVFEGGKGRRVTAADFEYSFNRIIDGQVNSPGAWIFNGKVIDERPFVALDDTLFVVRLKEAFRPMLGIFTMQYCSVVPREAVEFHGTNFRSNPVGTGPFQFKTWVENQTLILSKNPNYFEQDGSTPLPLADGIRVNFISDRKTAYLEFLNNRLDFISGLEASFVNELLTKDGQLLDKHQTTIDFYKSPFLNSEYLGILMDFEGDNADSPLRFKKVRQALNYGIDRERMLQQLRNNVGKAANAGFVPLGLPSFDANAVKGYTYNPEKATQLLAEAGFPNGQDMPTIKLYTSNDYLDLCTYITRQWEDLGVNASIELLQSATLRNLMAEGKAPFFRASWIADYPDAESFLTVFYSKNPSPPNYTRFNNARFDELYEAALQENDDAKRYQLYQAMDNILIDEAPVIFLFYDETARFSHKRITGFDQNALNLLRVKRLKINQ